MTAPDVDAPLSSPPPEPVAPPEPALGPPSPRPPLTRATRLAAAGLLALFAALATWGAWVKSETYDEPMYIFTAYSYVATGDLSLNREHPPLAKYLMGLPLLLLDLELPADAQQRPGIPYDFISHQPRADHHTMLFLARLPGILLGLVLGLYVFRWAHLAFGARAGLAALALYATNPNMLAHCRVAANDFASTVFIFAALYHVWRWLETDRRGSLALGALTLGFALGSKLTALMLLPVIGVLVLGAAISRRRPVLLGRATLALFAAAGVLWLLYLGEARSLDHAREHARFLARGEDDIVLRTPGLESGLEAVFGSDTPIPMLTFIKGLDHQLDHASVGHLSYFWGEVGNEAQWNFYLVTSLLKNPEALWFLVLLGLVSLRRTWRGGVHEWCLGAFVLLTFWVFSRSNVQLGFKYVLPIVPFLCVMASRVLTIRPGGTRPLAPVRELALGAAAVLALTVGCAVVFHDRGDAGWRAATPWLGVLVWGAFLILALGRRRTGNGGIPVTTPAVALVVWAALASLARQPDDLMYFNEWAGGPEHGWHYSVLGDDWGQDTAGLGAWMAERGVDHIYYDYYGTAEPENWGVRSTPTFAGSGFDPIEGLVAVHVTMLARAPQDYGWLLRKQPIDKIGNTIFIYDVTAADRVDALFDRVKDSPPR